MFGIGGTEILVILVVALIVFGPQKLPDLARTMGKAMGEFRRVSTEFQRTLNTEIATEEHEKRKKEAEDELFGDTDKNHEAKAHAAKSHDAQSTGTIDPKANAATANAAEANVTIDASTVSNAAPNPKPVASHGSVADNDKGAA